VAGQVGAGLTAVDPVVVADVVVSSRAAMPDLPGGPRKGREEGRLGLPSVNSRRGVLNKPSQRPMLKPSVTVAERYSLAWASAGVADCSSSQATFDYA
jgi:hypothetical protein